MIILRENGVRNLNVHLTKIKNIQLNIIASSIEIKFFIKWVFHARRLHNNKQLPISKTKKKKDISSLSLAIAAGLTEMLHLNGFKKIGLKWPNDFVCEGKKLGGILIETKSTDKNFMKTIVGIGLNLDLPNTSKEKEEFGLKPISLNSLKEGSFDVSDLIANLISSVNSTINKYKYSGFDKFARAWRRYDVYSGSYIHVESNNKKISGVNKGIDNHGALIINNKKGSHKIYSGTLIQIGTEG